MNEAAWLACVPVGFAKIDQDAGDAAGPCRDVALRAIELGALKRGMPGLLLVEDVEDRALSRIERDELDHLAFVDLPNIHVVVEVERPRKLRRDVLVLKARLRKHQRLRADGHVQLF